MYISTQSDVCGVQVRMWRKGWRQQINQWQITSWDIRFFSDFHAIWMIYTQIYGIMCAYCVHMRICAPLYRLLQRINDSESAKIDLHQSSLFRSFLLWTRTSSSLPPSLSLFLYLVFVWIFFSSLSFIYSENYMLWLKLLKRFPLNFFFVSSH